MLTRERRRHRLTLLLGSVAVFLILCFKVAGPATLLILSGVPLDWTSQTNAQRSPPPPPQKPIIDVSAIRPPMSENAFIGPNGEIIGFAPPTTLRPGGGHPLHTELQSVTTQDRKFFRIKFGTEETFNPNILPHPHRENTWIIVAQRGGVVQPSVELVCNAKFINDTLMCIDADGRGFGEPEPLPIEPTTAVADASKCPHELDFVTISYGPRDARVLYGPRSPFVVYGSNSQFTCFGQWIQDFRGLVPDWATDVDGAPPAGEAFTDRAGTELQRQPPYGVMEKNWFLFWDVKGDPYVHFDLTPSRSFAKLNPDGSVGKDLALNSAKTDVKCLARYLPRLIGATFESVHQATNSLSVTLCRRSDPGCKPTEDNTFIFTIYQHKTYYEFHATYHPYVMVFRQSAPFEVWAVSTRPLWISGRSLMPNGDTEMFYVTSISWREKGQTYHGYADDVLFLAFGIEDKETAGMDVLAGDLLANLGLCEE
ncbi:hypothetical protein N0V93_003701 [Gnomoniopsis smithogilvyi]|uniref:Uncharacterized protein n=1 Tax=Gnomoniopsis smithogilvyi TaxID=1191159 RepID=A0A9W9D0A1_9PEZI|nr:hypothetical protein N0V93_003701 [Gnomoniopsis smithogilvyi]